MAHDWAWLWRRSIGILVIALPLMLAVAMIIYAERKIWPGGRPSAWTERVGPWGLLQSFADGLKVFLEETIDPDKREQGPAPDRPDRDVHRRSHSLGGDPILDPGVVLADVNVGLASCARCKLARRLWSDRCRFGHPTPNIRSALRAAAQMVSYEVSIGLV